MLRGAIIGSGNVALEGHLPGWLRCRDVEIVAATDVEPARRAAIAARVPTVAWYDTVDALLARERLDFVDICTPPASHGPLVAAALRAGRHVLSEKPLVISPEELAPLTRLAGEHGRVLYTVHNWHHAPIVKRTAELLAQGAIGEVRRVSWQTLRTKPAAVRDGRGANWRLDPTLAGGGVLTDHGWHVFYVICRWVGESPTSVGARLETRRHTAWAVEDTATVHLAFPRATAEILLTWAADRRKNRAELIGTEGRLDLEDDTLVLTRNGGQQRWPCPPAMSDGSAHPDWFDPVVSQFVGEVTGAVRPDGNLAEASLCTTLESLARESSRQGGRAVRLAATTTPAW
jgi:predicted dehydrogenase